MGHDTWNSRALGIHSKPGPPGLCLVYGLALDLVLDAGWLATGGQSPLRHVFSFFALPLDGSMMAALKIIAKRDS